MVIAVVASADVVEVVHRAGAYAVVSVPPAVVVPAVDVLGHAANGAHGFVLVVHGGQRRRLRASSTASVVLAFVEGAHFSHVIH